LRVRNLFSLLFLATLVASAYYLLDYVPKHSKPGEPVLALADYFLTYAPIQGVKEAAYVVPDSLQAWNTPAEIRTPVATLQSGEEVQALGHFRGWVHVHLADGQDGWVSSDGLMNAETHEKEERLREEISDMPVQARGHAGDVNNVHIEPSRQAGVVAQVNPQQSLEIFGRRMVRRSYEKNASDILPVSSGQLEAWYLVQEGSHAGWILGHRVRLDIPESISAYAQDTNLVAWVVLDTVDDNGHQIPQYLVADRVGTQTCDFTDIRVLTWWKKKQTYAIAYKDGGLQGYFPILVTHEGSVPYFRLLLVDDAGNECQKIYGLFETITRLMGTADTWQRDVMPEQPASRAQKRVARPPVTMRG
jgi:uncharacterized protein YgiM (DUF1202 family)